MKMETGSAQHALSHKMENVLSRIQGFTEMWIVTSQWILGILRKAGNYCNCIAFYFQDSSVNIWLFDIKVYLNLKNS